MSFNIKNNLKVIYNNEELPNINKYVYLGVEINDQLDYKEMANYRTRVGNQTLDTMKKTLPARSLPMIFKSMANQTKYLLLYSNQIWF